MSEIQKLPITAVLQGLPWKKILGSVPVSIDRRKLIIIAIVAVALIALVLFMVRRRKK